MAERKLKHLGDSKEPPYPGWAIYEIHTCLDKVDKEAINKWIWGQMDKDSSVGAAGERFEFAFAPCPKTGGCQLTVRDLKLNEELKYMGNT